MATVHVHVTGDPRRLLERAAEAFLRAPPLDDANPLASPAHVLLLRQGGMRDDLLALAAARGVPGWFDPPMWVFGEIPERLGGLEERGVGDYARVVLVERALREVAEAAAERGEAGVFASITRPEAYVDALDRLFGELASEGVRPEAFDAARSMAPGTDGFECRRDAEVAAVYRRYVALLDEADAIDGRDRLLRTAREIASAPDAFAARLAGRREVRIAGLLDLKSGWLELLRALAAAPALDHVRIYTSAELPLPADLRAVIESGDDDAARSSVSPLPSGSLQFSLALDGAPPAPHIARAAFSAPGMEREAEEVAARVRRLIDGGVAPDRIAIVARQARPGIDAVCAALDAVRVPATARRRTTFAEIPVVRAVLMLFAAAADGWTRHALVELAEQPYLGLRLDATVLNHIGFRRRVAGLGEWDAAMAKLLDDALAAEAAGEVEDEQGVRRERLPPSERVARAIDSFGRFVVHARELDDARTLDAWLGWFAAFLGDDPWHIARAIWRVPAGGERIVRLDAAGWRGMIEIVNDWRKAVGRWGGGDDRLDAAGFEQRLRAVLSGDVALWTETRRGVQVLEALAAAQRSFDHVFLVGLDTDRVPVRAPRSPILDEADRERLAAAGIPLELRATWDTRERALLAALEKCAAMSLTLSYARLDAKRAEVAASSFYEELLEAHAITEEVLPTSRVLTPGVPVAADAAALDTASHGARIEALRAAGGASPWNGLIVVPEIRRQIAERLDERFVWSPTGLETYAKCPWSWFSARLLRLAKLEDPELGLDPRVRGTLFHDALHRFYDTARERVGGPVFLRKSDQEWACEAVAAALAESLAAAGEEFWVGHGVLRPRIAHELERELVRFVAAEIDHNEKLFSNWQRHHFVRTAVVAHEQAFDDVELAHRGVTFRVRGVIDRVEVAVDDRDDTAHLIAAVDYKSSRWSAPAGGDKEGWDDGVVLQVPLYAWVLTQLRAETDVARTEYRAIRQGTIVHPLHLHQIERKSKRLVRSDSEAAKYESARDAIAAAVRAARDGRFPAAPAPSCGCPDFCHAREICRVKDGPRSMFDW